MSKFAEKIEACFVRGGIDLKALMEICNVRFENLSLDDVRFVESECGELRQKFEDAEKVEGYKTRGLSSLGFSDGVYFGLDEIEIIKDLVSKQIQKGNFNFEVKKLKISRDVLVGHIRDRKEWEEI